MQELTIAHDVYAQMLEQARAEAPVEACGLLGGADGKVAQLYKMTNVDASSDHFMMDPAEQFAAIKAMRSASQRMLAIYHSHPASPARPSEEDIRLALTPGVIYVIVSLADAAGPVVKGFLIEDGAVTQTPVVVENE